MTPIRSLSILSSASLVLCLAACAKPNPTPSVPPVDTNPAAVDAIAIVRVEPAMLSGIHVEAATLRSMPRVLRATGKVQFDEGRIARVLAPVAGQVTGLKAKVGDRVRQDETIFSLNSRDAAAAVEDQLDAVRDLDLAEKNLAMTQDLFDHQAASQSSLRQAQNDVAKAHARVDRTSGALDAIGVRHQDDPSKPIDPRVPVSSPVSGAVIERHVSDGQYVQPDPNPLLIVADLSQVWVEADVFERDLHLLRAGQAADVTATAYPDDQFHARVDRISDVLDPTTRTAKVRFVVANPSLQLKPEMFADVTLFVDELQQAISVPSAAVLTEGDRTFVYVQIDDRTFARRSVDVAPDSKNSRRILRGLTAGDRVVTAGVLLLRAQESRSAN